MTTWPVSPAVETRELDMSIVPVGSSTTVGAYVGIFPWGDVNSPKLVSSVANLIKYYGKPSDDNYESFFTAYNFLSYGSTMYVNRSGNTSATSNTMDGTWTNSTVFVVESNATGVETDYLVQGPGISTNTIVSSVTINGSNTEIEVNKSVNSTVNGTSNGAVFLDSIGLFTAIANVEEIDQAFGIWTIANTMDYETKSENFDETVPWIARNPGSLGNSLKISVCDSSEAYNSTIDLANVEGNTSGADDNTGISFVVGSNTATITIANSALTENTTSDIMTDVKKLLTVGDYIVAGNASTIGTSKLKITEIGNVTVVTDDSGVNTGATTLELSFKTKYNLAENVTSTSFGRYWEYYSLASAPGQSQYQSEKNSDVDDEIHIVVVDEDGKFSGTSGTILETFLNLSRATDALDTESLNNYYANVINDDSNYIRFAYDRTGATSATALELETSTNKTPLTLSFWGGADGSTESSPDLTSLLTAWDVFASKEDYSINLVPLGKVTSTQLINYVIENVAEVRKDITVFASPTKAICRSGSSTMAEDIVEFFDEATYSSYLVCDCNYKYMYDKYNAVYRWIPMNSDVAGCCVTNDDLGEVWTSPAGKTRGLIKNVVKLAWNPTRDDRDILYPAYVNPIMQKPSVGVLLFGDRTHLGYQSAFSNINVRRLFNYLKDTISSYAENYLFELNNEFTRTRFYNMIDPILKDILTSEGIYGYKIICDETNNTDEIIDANRFVASILIKPARSINFIMLNFAAVATSVDFDEAATAI